MTAGSTSKAVALLCAVLAGLFALQFVVSDYLVLTMTRIMVLAIFASGYNVLLGYTGLLSLGHALFFAAGLYGAGLTAYHLDWSVPLAFAAGIGAAFLVSLAIGFVTLRTIRVSFMIATMMFSQVGFLLTLYYSRVTGGDQGLTLPSSARAFSVFGTEFDLADATVRYNIAFGLLAATLVLIFAVTHGKTGRLLVAVRENEDRTEMLGFNIYAIKLNAFVLSGTIAGMAGAAYGLLFGYIGSTFASIQYSIEALLFTLLGGAGTLFGPLLGTFVMTTLIDRLSEFTTAHLLAVGLTLVALTIWFPKGILGTVRQKWLPWLS